MEQEKSLIKSLGESLTLVSRLLEAHEERLNVHEAKLNLLAAMVGLLDVDDAKDAARDMLSAHAVRVDMTDLTPEQREALKTLGVELPDDAPKARAETSGYL